MSVPTGDDIILDHVTKIFSTGLWRRRKAVDDLSLNIAPGEIVGLLGPNGSGKSTTIKMLLGLLRPTQGDIWIGGYVPAETRTRERIGYLPENPRFQRFLTARQILRYYANLLALPNSLQSSRIASLLDLVGLTPFADERVQGFSKGMVQRLAVAQSLLQQPAVLLFDEPMSGLDPVGRLEIRQLISQIHSEMPWVTILLSTHALVDVELLCSRVVVLCRGKLAIDSSVSKLIENHSQQFEVLVESLPEGLKLKYGSSRRPSPLGELVSIQGVEELRQELDHLASHGARVVGITSERRALESALFGREAYGRAS